MATDGRDDPRAENLDADRLEEDWEHALDAASGALSASDRSQSLTREDLATGAEHVQNQRKWLHGFRPTLRRLFPGRSRD